MSLETSVDDTPLTFDSPSLDWGTPAQDPSSGSDPSADANAPASTPEAATVPPVDTPPADAKPRESAGPIPFDRHQAILETERQRRVELETQLSWASQLVKDGKTPEQIQRALAIEAGLAGNSVGFIEQLLSEALSHPSLAAQVRSLAGRMLGGGRTAEVAQTTNEAEPEPDLFYDHPDGKRSWVRSAENQQAWNAWQTRQLEKRFEEKLAPLDEVRRNLETQRQQAEADANYRAEWQRYYDEGAKQLAELEKEPYYDADFKTAMQEFVKQNNGVTIRDAWLHVLRTRTVPMSTEKGRSTAIADLRTKAAASSSVPPKGAASGVPVGPKGFFDPNLKW